MGCIMNTDGDGSGIDTSKLDHDELEMAFSDYDRTSMLPRVSHNKIMTVLIMFASFGCPEYGTPKHEEFARSMRLFVGRAKPNS